MSLDDEPAPDSSALIRAARERGIPVMEMSPVGAVLLGGAIGWRRARALADAGSPAEAVAVYADRIAHSRRSAAAFEAGGAPVSAQLKQTFDLCVAVGLAEMGCVELDMRRLDEALAHTSEAARIVPRDGVHDPDARFYVAQVLTGFAAVRASARRDLVRAADLAAEAVAIHEELERQTPAEQHGRLELARRLHAQILQLMGQPGNPCLTQAATAGDAPYLMGVIQRLLFHGRGR